MPNTANETRTDPFSLGVLDSVAIEPLKLDRGAGAQIFDAMKAAILRMDIPPGSLISEADVAACFGASRTPVREAFLQLRGAGMVVTRPSRGNFVTKLSEARVRESRFVREAIELAVIDHLCANGMSADSKDGLSEVLKRQKNCLENDKPIEFQLLDDMFHMSLAAATGFPRMAELLEQEKMHLDRLRVFSLKHQPRKEVLFQEHLHIFEAVTAGDRRAAMKTMRNHLSSILETLALMAQEHSEYFE